jgi:predicted metal-dependent hydrolase
MAEIIRRRARTIDDRALAEACQGSLSGHAAEGLALLNSGQFYEAHESLEAAWMEAPELEGYLYRSLLQIAVACLHVERGNYAGATKMLLRLKQWIDPLPDQCKGVEVATLKLKVAEFSDALEAAGPERIGDIKLRPLPVVLLSAS